MSKTPEAYRVHVVLTLDVHAPTLEDAIDRAYIAADGIVFHGSPIEDIQYAVVEDGPDAPTPIRYTDA
jgi:hypothetical protein